ncbi:MAG: peptidylprolyl isomerase, partial [Pseudomonadota bacterium]|nr:peptidylprolyl isomerase [Pseudomonadota bacterium]
MRRPRAKRPAKVIEGLAGALLMVFSMAVCAAPLDRVLIVINNEAITESDYNARYRQQLLELQGRGRVPSEAQIKSQLMEKIIIDQVLVQEARSRGIKVSDQEVDATISALAERNRVSTSQLLVALEKDGVAAADFREGMRERLLTKRLIDARINSAIRVTDEEIDDYLQNHTELEQGDLSYEFSRIFMALPEEAEEEERQAMREKAQQALGEIRDGEFSFAAAARIYSDGKQRPEGGYQGWKSADQLPELYLQALRGMGSDEVSDVLESANGFHILRLEDTRGSGGTVEQAHVRHILLRPSPILPEEEVLNRLRQLRERIEVKGDSFADLATLYSEDP